jgi:ubiquinone/menaquinone biosynthesis C-methylase UbiE
MTKSFQRASPVLRGEEVPAAFDTGAAAYDRLVGANPGYHAHLRLSAHRMRLPGDGRGLRLLDAGCGTGASTAALLTAAPHAEIVAIDASAQMLAQTRAKGWPPSVRFVHARVENLAGAGVRGPFDGILAAYLIRNLADPDGQLRALRDLLRSGGTLAVHEYSVRDSLRARATWNAVCWSVIIPSGRLATGDASLYRYLWRSVEGFDGVRRFRRRLREAGFTGVHSETMTGWQRDVVHTFLASAPPVITAGTPPDAASAPPVITAGTPSDAASAPPVITAGTPPDAASAPPVITRTG